MHLRYINAEGKAIYFTLGEQQVVIGRSEDADISIIDDEISRYHTAIILWDGDYVVKDLKTSNGTLLNGENVDVAVLKNGAIIRIASHDIFFEDKAPTVGRGPNTVIRKINREMDSGKGFGDMMEELVRDAETKTAPPSQENPE